MKRVILIPLCFFWLSTEAQDSSEYSYDEIMSWVKGKYDSQEFESSYGSVFYDYEFIYNDCNCLITYKTRNKDKSFLDEKNVTVWYYQFDLSKTEKIKESIPQSGFKNVELWPLYGQKIFTSDLKMHGYNSEPLKVDHVYIPTEESLAPRIIKALKDAMKLCGGGLKKEKY